MYFYFVEFEIVWWGLGILFWFFFFIEIFIFIIFVLLVSIIFCSIVDVRLFVII